MPNDSNALPPETAQQEITPVLRIYTEQTSDTGGIWGLKPWAFRHVCWVPEQDYHAALDRAEVAEAATVKVKPLVWQDIAPRHSKAALPLFGNVRAESWGGDFSVVWSVPGMCDTFTEGKWPTLDAAKAAAQADYEARILTSLQKSQTTPAPVWHFLDEWQPPEGTWAILWPGYYGPFTACRIGGEWSMCDDQDLNNATIATPCPEPRHDMTDHFVIKERGEE